MQPVNGRRTSTAPRMKRDYYAKQPENSEIINYVNDSWNEVYRNRLKPSFIPGATSVTFYQPSNLSNRLTNIDFKPFDLESYWGKKVYQYQNCSESRSL